MRSSSLRRFERDLIDQNPTRTERAGSIFQTMVVWSEERIRCRVLPNDDRLVQTMIVWSKRFGAITNKVVSKQRLPLNQASFDASNAPSLTEIGPAFGAHSSFRRMIIVLQAKPSSFVVETFRVYCLRFCRAQREREMSPWWKEQREHHEQ